MGRVSWPGGELPPRLSFARFMPTLTGVAAFSQSRAGLRGGESPSPRARDANIMGDANRSGSMSDPEKRNGEGPSTGVIVKAKPKTKKPSMYKVLMLNDDYTPMEFVVHILERFFAKTREEATRIMLHVHRRGVGICGVFTYEVAETKVTQVMDFARQNQHPLQCTLEKE
jgi:ATP-dependent Clp protease adaptor protein ClpS